MILKGAVFALVLGAAVLVQQLLSPQAAIAAGEKLAANPMKGFMVWGENYIDDPLISFAYVPVYWDELEPEEGRYDFDALEERCHFAQWRKKGVRLVLRVVLDNPTGESHMDLPQWLYDKMDGAGTWYDSSYGKGFSPDYESEVLIEAHAKLIRALAERYAQDPQVAFVQLGSLGHWGEWHVNTKAGIDPFPLQQVSDRYVEPYLETFGAAKLMMRRPFAIAAEQGIGLYNDSFGDPKSHETWLSWIESGYMSDQNQEWLPGMPDFWQSAPSGGEFASSYELEWYFSPQQFPTTLELARRSHTTLLGPKIPKRGSLSGRAEQNRQTLLAELGYCLGVRSCRLTQPLVPGPLEVSLTWENTGVAPLYADWPLQLEIRDIAGQTVWSRQLDCPLSQWGPGRHQFSAVLEGTEELPLGRYTLSVGIVDPLIGCPGVALQMETRHTDRMYDLLSFWMF